MQVGSSDSLSAQLKALQDAALGQYQSGQGFSALLQQSSQTGSASTGSSASTTSSSASSSSSSSSSSSGDYQFSSSFTSDALIAVGTMTPDGKMVPFSQQQVQSEEDSVAQAGKSAYGNALQNFLTLSKASGQLTSGSLTDEESYVSSNGMVSANFDTSMSLKPVGGGVPSNAT